jgi:hypothetical protein
MIRLASDKEAKHILLEPQIVARVGLLAEHIKVQPWIAHNDMHQLLFVFWEIEDGVYEMHIASPKDSIRSSRKLTVEAMEWLFSMCADKIITNCPRGKISNMAKKLGLKLYDTDGQTDHYEVTSWELKQHY